MTFLSGAPGVGERGACRQWEGCQTRSATAMRAGRSRTFIVAPPQVIFAAEQYQGYLSETVLDIAERFFRLHVGEANNPSGHGFHDASVLGRLVIGIYDQEPHDSPLASRALDLIDAMILARTYGRARGRGCPSSCHREDGQAARQSKTRSRLRGWGGTSGRRRGNAADQMTACRSGHSSPRAQQIRREPE